MSPSGGSGAIPATPIAHHFGLHPRGRDAIASFPNNVTNINPANYTWVKGSSNYTLCHDASSEPTQALLWLVGNIDGHSLSTATAYENWTVDILLPAETNKALDNLLKTGPWKEFTKPNRYSILKTKATLRDVKDELRDDDDEGLMSLAQTITADDPFPYTYNGSMMAEGGLVPNAGYDVSNFTNQATVAVELSILGYQIEGKEPGYSFACVVCIILEALQTVQQRRRPRSARPAALSVRDDGKVESSTQKRQTFPIHRPYDQIGWKCPSEGTRFAN